jgi:enoyl-CoA hydratase/carnithine racemase
MMMTGRVYKAVEAEKVGLTQYLVPTGNALEKAIELGKKIAQNAPLTNYALIHALPRISEQPADHGFLTEALISSITQSAPEAKKRVRDFLEGNAAKVKAE